MPQAGRCFAVFWTGPTVHHLILTQSKSRGMNTNIEPTWPRAGSQLQPLLPLTPTRNENKKKAWSRRKGGVLEHAHTPLTYPRHPSPPLLFFWLRADVRGSSTVAGSLRFNHPLMQPQAQRVTGAPRTNCASTFWFFSSVSFLFFFYCFFAT